MYKAFCLDPERLRGIFTMVNKLTFRKEKYNKRTHFLGKKYRVLTQNFWVSSQCVVYIKHTTKISALGRLEKNKSAGFEREILH